MQIPRAILWVAVVGFGGFGLAFAAFPDAMAALVDIQLPTDTARADFIAIYGGLELGLAAFFWMCIRHDDRVRVGLLASGYALTGFGGARLIGILRADDPRPILIVLLLIELPGAALSFWGARRAAEAEAGLPAPALR